MSTLLERISTVGIVPVVIAHSPDEGLFIGRSLAAGGMPIAEVTFRTPAAAEAIARIAGESDVLVGAGTVITAAQVDTAVAAGASFLVSPGTSRAVVERAGEHGVPIITGAVTATEIQAALELGLRTVKFFPAEASGGAGALRAMTAPFPDVAFLPTGGIGPANLAAYRAIDAVVAVGGSWMLPADAIAARDGERISALARAAVDAAAL